jgi:hypothetical protein
MNQNSLWMTDKNLLQELDTVAFSLMGPVSIVVHRVG